MIYLNEEILEKLCQRIAREVFGRDEEPLNFADHDARALNASLTLPQQKTFGRELYPTLAEKAAILFIALNCNHPFGNGNKRMSAASLAVFLILNDHYLEVGPREFYEKTIWVADKGSQVEFDELKKDVTKWIEGALAPFEEADGLKSRTK